VGDERDDDVYAALDGIEVDRAGDLGEDELLVPATAEADRLVDAAHARAREADPDLGLGRLEITRIGRVGGRFALEQMTDLKTIVIEVDGG